MRLEFHLEPAARSEEAKLGRQRGNFAAEWSCDGGTKSWRIVHAAAPRLLKQPFIAMACTLSSTLIYLPESDYVARVYQR